MTRAAISTAPMILPRATKAAPAIGCTPISTARRAMPATPPIGIAARESPSAGSRWRRNGRRSRERCWRRRGEEAPSRDLERSAAQRLDARQRLAFHPFEEGAAGGRDIAEAMRDAGAVQRGDGVAAAGDRDELALFGALCDVMRELIGALFEAGELEGAERAVPDDSLGLVDRRLDAVDRELADIEHHAGLGDRVDAVIMGGRMGRELEGDDGVDRQQDGAARLLRFGEDRAGGFGEVLLAERLADRIALRVEKRIGHAAADDQRVDLGDEIAEEVELAGDFGAADDGDQRTLGRLQRLAERFEFCLHRAASEGGQLMRDALGRGMGAMGGGKGVVDIEIAEFGEFVDEGRIVLFLAFVEAGG